MIIQDNIEIFFDNDNPFLTKLTEDKMVGMEGELTLPECLIVLKNMSNGKSPCLDGITSEFCKFLINLVFEILRANCSHKQNLKI
jgi:hypothetical protein